MYKAVGDELIVHLPETVPYLSELLEDDREQVEMSARRLIKLIEEYLGESLEDHLK